MLDSSFGFSSSALSFTHKRYTVSYFITLPGNYAVNSITIIVIIVTWSMKRSVVHSLHISSSVSFVRMAVICNRLWVLGYSMPNSLAVIM